MPSTNNINNNINNSNEEIYNIPLQTIDGETSNLNEFRGKVIVCVNTASRCGFTRQYKSLQKLYEKHKEQGLVICGFPSNQFNQQEPGTEQQIKCFIKDKYNVTFPMFAKADVKGKNCQALYEYLQKHCQQQCWLPFIPWNFCKIIIDRQGNVLKRALPWGCKKSLENSIKKLL